MFFKRELDDDFNEELAAHVEMATEDNVRAGLNPKEARRQAIIRFGGVESTRELHRDARGLPLFESFARDVRYGFRSLRHNPGFTAAAILTIALGVGLNTGVFSILNAIVFSDLPVPAAHELVEIHETVKGLPGRNEKGRINRRVTTAEYRTYRDHTEALSGLAGFNWAWPVMLGGENSREITGRYVSCNYFDVLQQPPSLGRSLRLDDCKPGAAPVVMLSHSFWTTMFAADPSIIGRTVKLNLQPVTVVGVAAENAYQPELQKLDFFAPISAQPFLRPDRQWFVSEEFGWLTLIGRLRSGSSIEQVNAEFNVIASQIDQQHPGRSTVVSVKNASASTFLLQESVRPSLITAGIVVVMAPFGFILLIACANVANLFLARAPARTPEIALRVSLGANRKRVILQLLTESLLVSVIGGALGLTMAYFYFGRLASLVLSSLPVSLPEPQLDVSLLMFALALSVLAGILAGLAPALKVSNPNLYATTMQTASGAGRDPGKKLQSMFIGIQVAICVVLLIGTGLLLRNLYHANTIDPGFPYQKVTVVSGDLRDFGYVGEKLVLFQNRLAEQVGALPGIESVGFTVAPPWDERSESENIYVRNEGELEHQLMRIFRVEQSFIFTLGIPLVRGRLFDTEDFTENPDTVIVSESAARDLWQERDPIGQTLQARVTVGPEIFEERALRVIGVVGDAQMNYMNFDVSNPNCLYIPSPLLGSQYRHMLSLIVRSRAGFSSVAPNIRAVLQRLDPDVAMRVMPLEENLNVYRSLSAITSGLAVSLGLLALILVAVGVYGIVSYVVNLRTHEIGIRLALGARKSNVLKTILKHVMLPVCIGIVIGCTGAIAASNILSSVLFGVSYVDPISLGGAAIFVLGVVLLAGFLPARRAAGMDPASALRTE
jgi:predicted permease